MNGFKQFILRGNVVDLAVGVVIGAAFNSVVSSFVANILTPVISAFGGQPHFQNLAFTFNKTSIKYGDFLNAVITFLIIAAVVYFLIVMPMNKLEDAVKSGKAPDPTTKNCPYCFTSIPIKAVRCPNCIADLNDRKTTDFAGLSRSNRQ